MISAGKLHGIITQEVGDHWHETNLHGVNLRESMIWPEMIEVSETIYLDGEFFEFLIDVWLVLIEVPDDLSSYKIVADSDGSQFGLAYGNFAPRLRPALFGWHGDFMTTFHGM